ncbi:MAG TPA: ATP-binding protein [Polyangiaceae bacterium]|nr:ATP-binding protein [Polyangiaceae bacterium]
MWQSYVPPVPLLQALWDEGSFGLAVLDERCCYVHVNAWLAELQGRSIADHIGRSVAEVAPALAEQVAEQARRVLTSGMAVLRVSARAFAGGTLLVSCYPLREDANTLRVGLVVQQMPVDSELLRTLSAERTAREQAEQANRMKDEFLATLGHELRTPLNAIVGWAHMLQNAQLGSVERARAVETIARNAKLQATIVDDLLDVSRIISGKLRLNLERVQVATVLETALDGARPAAEAKGLQLELEPSGQLLEVMGDAHRLQQIVWNLVSNAVKFTSRGGRVLVRARRAADGVRVDVTDTGQGIRPEFLPVLFERFRQADASTARHGGLGLGLAIVRHLVELHGGTVQASSPGLNQGSTFSVWLPAAPGKRAPAPASAEQLKTHVAEPARALSGACILVVDDDPDARELFQALLSREGAEVLTAASAAQAFEVLRKRAPDVIVCDIGMPEQDGYSFLRKLRASGEAAGGWVPALAVTGYAMPKDSQEALLAGFQMHVCKPIDPPHVLASIVKLWRRGVREIGR